MKSDNNEQTEEEILLEEIDNDTQFEGKNYDEILAQIKRLKDISGKAFIPALCVAYKREHITLENVDIKNHVVTDCLEIGLWTELTIEHYLPKWVTRTYPLNRKKFEDVSNSPEEQQSEQNAEVIVKTLDFIEQEQERKEKDKEDQSAEATSAGGPSQPKEKELLSPIKLYEKGVKSSEKLWTALTGKDRLIASDKIDVLLEHIKPTRKYRLRIFKGLDTARANHYQMVLVWLDKLIQDTLKDCLEINRERKTDEITK